MKKSIASLAICLMVMAALSGVGSAHALTTTDGTSLGQAILITTANTEYDLTLASSSQDDCKYYQFTPEETATYVIGTQPSAQEVWVSMYRADNPELAVDGYGLWYGGFGDFAIAHYLTAGYTYYFKVGAYFGSVNGKLLIVQDDEVAGAPMVEPMPVFEGAALDASLFADATVVSKCNRPYEWSINNMLWDEAGMPIGDFQDEYFQFTPAQTGTYSILSQPSAYDSYLTLYTITIDGDIVEVDTPWGEFENESGIWDYLIEIELLAQQPYYVRVSSIEGGNGTLTILDGTQSSADTQPDNAPGAKVESLTTKVGTAGYSIGGVTKDMAPCYYKGNDTMMPIRMLEDLGVTFQWNSATQTATMSYGDNTVVLTIGSTEALINGVKTPIVGASGAQVAPELAPGRTMIPLRFVSQQLGFKVHWDPSHQVTIER